MSDSHRHRQEPEPAPDSGTGPGSPQHTADELPQTEDLDLESAIGNAFKQFAFINHNDNNTNDPHHSQNDNPAEHNGSNANDCIEDGGIDLEAAVGNAFLALAELMGQERFDLLDREMDNEKSVGALPQENTDTGRESAIEERENALLHTAAAHDLHSPKNRSPNFSGKDVATVASGQDNTLLGATDVNPEVDSKAHEPDTQEPELDLEAAIGNAFKNLTDDLQAGHLDTENGHLDTENVERLLSPPQTKARDTIHDQEEAKILAHPGPAPQSESEKQTQSGTEGHQDNENRQDNKLEDAIDQAFKSLSNEFDHLHKNSTEAQISHEEDDDNILHQAIFASFSEIMGHDKHQRAQSILDSRETEDLDLNSVVQNVVLQISLESNPVHEQDLAISKEMLQDLALEISHKVHYHEETRREPTPKEIPHIDDNILAHFQLEANKGDDKHEDAKDDDSELKNALASAMRNVLQHATGEDTEVMGDKPENLEKLQMNEILQNAFNMAMQNPQELLTSLELNDEELSSAGAKNLANDSSTFSTAAAIAALSVKEALNKHGSHADDAMGEKSAHAIDGKTLSIAETLALRRSPMPMIASREFSQTQAIDDSTSEQQKVSMNPQLSSILSSLSQHIQSGNQSQNLMLVIRQMTNALMLNKASSYTMSSATQEILQEVQTQPHEQKFFVDSLKKAKSFLSRDTADEVKRRALLLIENVIGLVNGKNEDGVGAKELGSILENPSNQIELPTLSQFYTTALSTLSNFNSSRFRGFGGEKLDVDSNEYKEKIRVENRERKKRWREENSERNKDNDLRSRVIKRANYMFGDSQSAQKKAWVEEEFSKRRAKRLAKQKKEETEKAVDNQLFVDKSSPEVKQASTIYSQDPKLVKRLTDFFKIVAEAGNDEDPQALMTATSAATAVAASEYATTLGISDGHIIQNAMSHILNNVLDTTVRSGNFTRISFLSKGLSFHNSSLPRNENSDLINSITGTSGISHMESGERKSALDILRSSQKRFGMDFLSGDSKRLHLDKDASGLHVEKEKSSMSRIQYEIDQLRNSISTSTSGHIWGSSTGLKMPLYRKPHGGLSQDARSPEIPQKEVSIPSLPAVASPFISNKIGLKSEQSSSVLAGSGGLKKPGSFQRPAFSRTNKGKSLGFPTFYSASYSQK